MLQLNKKEIHLQLLLFKNVSGGRGGPEHICSLPRSVAPHLPRPPGSSKSLHFSFMGDLYIIRFILKKEHVMIVAQRPVLEKKMQFS